MAPGCQALFTGSGMQLRGQQYMHDVRPRIPKHRPDAVERCRNSIACLDQLRAIDIDVADRDGLRVLRYRLQGRSMTFRYVSCTKESDAKSPLRGGWAGLRDGSPLGR
jgi:hypothetical protein